MSALKKHKAGDTGGAASSLAEAQRAILRIGVAVDQAFPGMTTPLCTICPDGWDNACTDPMHRIVHIVTGMGNAGTGWFCTATGILCTCEHVRLYCVNKIGNNISGRIIACPYLGDGQEPIDWRLAWEVEVLAHMQRHAEARGAPCLADTCDLAVLRPTRELVSGDPVSGNAHVPIPGPRGQGASGEAITYLQFGHTKMLESLHRDKSRLFCLGFPTDGNDTPTNTEGQYAGMTGGWIKYAGLMLGGHSGGPIINHLAQVVGWNVLLASDDFGKDEAQR